MTGDAAATREEDPLAADLRGFGPVGILAMAVILAGNLLVAPLSAVLALLWARRSGTPWREIGYVWPKRWMAGLAIGLVLGASFKILMKAIVMPLLGADPINPTYHYLVGNNAALPGILYAILVGAGFGEETLFRGYLFERLGRLFGAGLPAKVSIVLLTSALFGLAHYPDQGLAGTENAAITGLLFGTLFMATGSLWMPMCAHVAFDLIALGIIYYDLESWVAHLVFS